MKLASHNDTCSTHHHHHHCMVRPTLALNPKIYKHGPGPKPIIITTIISSYSNNNGCELRLRSTPRYQLVCNCFPDPGEG